MPVSTLCDTPSLRDQKFDWIEAKVGPWSNLTEGERRHLLKQAKERLGPHGHAVGDFSKEPNLYALPHQVIGLISV